MKTIISLILLSILTSSVYAQVQSSCEIDSNLEHYYKFDVADLTINRLFTISSPDTNEIEIPQAYQDSIWNGLAAIFNVESIPERDSVFDIFCVHDWSAFTNKLIPNIYIQLDTSVSWTSNWQNNEIVTGYTELDQFIATYNYSILSSGPNYTTVVLYSDLIINSYAISDSLVSFIGIETAGPIPMTIDNNRIYYSVDGEHQYYSFILAWGDCMSGCIYKHQWDFKVHYSSCTVEYLGLETNFNNNLPSPPNCNITAINDSFIETEIISIFPNPASDKISIKGENIQNIVLLNGLGQYISTINPNNNLTEINIQELMTGIYFLKIEIDGKLISKRFVKQ